MNNEAVHDEEITKNKIIRKSVMINLNSADHVALIRRRINRIGLYWLIKTVLIVMVAMKILKFESC